jgi:hypothetical protein
MGDVIVVIGPALSARLLRVAWVQASTWYWRT